MIEVAIQGEAIAGVAPFRLEEIARIVLEGEGRRDGLLSVALLSVDDMQEQNDLLRGKNEPTNVLSVEAGMFDEEEVDKLATEIGEVLLCPDVIAKEATSEKKSIEEHTAFCLIHGVLHCLGYDHEKGKTEAAKMAKKEKAYLKLVLSD